MTKTELQTEFDRSNRTYEIENNINNKKDIHIRIINVFVCFIVMCYNNWNDKHESNRT